MPPLPIKITQAMFEQLRQENAKLKTNEPGGGGADFSSMQDMLMRKQAELAAVRLQACNALCKAYVDSPTQVPHAMYESFSEPLLELSELRVYLLIADAGIATCACVPSEHRTHALPHSMTQKDGSMLAIVHVGSVADDLRCINCCNGSSM